MLKDPRVRANPQMQSQAKLLGISIDRYLKLLGGWLPGDGGLLEKMENCPDNAFLERVYFDTFKVMTPPEHAEEPEDLEAFFKFIRTGDVTLKPPEGSLQPTIDKIRRRWPINYTMLDKTWYALATHKKLVY